MSRSPSLGAVLWVMALVVGACTGCSAAQDPEAASPVDRDWLVGEWGLTYDPADGAKDYVEFLDDGRVLSKSVTGPTLEGTYRVDGDTVTLMFGRDRTLRVALTVSADRARLRNPSGAYYTRE